MATHQRRTDALALRRAIRRATAGPNPLLPPDRAIVVAVSGGPDSLALLHALVGESQRARLRLHVAHLHHGLRGPEADDDAAFVQSIAQAWGLPATIGNADVQAIQAQHGGS